MQNSRGKKRKPNTKDMAHVMRCRDKNFLDFLTVSELNSDIYRDVLNGIQREDLHLNKH